MTHLNSLLPVGSGWTITEAYGIDNSGDIVGAGVFKGVQYAVELVDPPSGGPSGPTQQNLQSPLATPEPLTALLMGGGLVAAGVLFRRKRKPKSPDRER
jgi:hypothetical protein